MVSGESVMPLFVNGKRLDGRRPDEMREVSITAGPLVKADGSAYLELGKNKVLAAVFGPREVFPKHKTDPYKAVVRCIYRMAPFSTEEHGRTRPNRRSIEISKVIREVFENVIVREIYPKTAIEIYIEILESNGSTRVAGLTAASVALANAGIPMRDLPVGVSVGKIDGKVVIDMMKDEDNYGQADMPLAIKPTTGEVLLIQMDGKMTRAEFEQALDMAFKTASEVHEKQVAALKDYYEKVEGEIGEGSGSNRNESNAQSHLPSQESKESKESKDDEIEIA